MIKFAAGLLVGLTLAAQAASPDLAHLKGHYFTTKTIVTLKDSRQPGGALDGYAAGVSDTLNYVLNHLLKVSNDRARDLWELADKARCLQFRGRRVGALKHFALDVWEKTPHDDEIAARALIMNACAD